MKRYSFIISLILLSLCIKAQDISTYFVSMPDSLIPHLENEWRKDLVDLYTSEKDARLQNMIGGYSTLEKLTSDYLLLRTSERGTMEIKLLPLVNNTHILCFITTVEGPVADSQVNFYTTDWTPLNPADLYTPVEGDFFIKERIASNPEEQFILDRLDMDLVRYSLNPDDLTLKAEYMTPLYLSKTEREKIQPYLKEEVKIYTWNKSYFN